MFKKLDSFVCTTSKSRSSIKTNLMPKSLFNKVLDYVNVFLKVILNFIFSRLGKNKFKHVNYTFLRLGDKKIV